MSSFDSIHEKVPQFVRRVGDHVIQGSNNAMVVFGTDRAAHGVATTGDGLGHVMASGKGQGTGTVHLIAGRTDLDGNVDLDTDLSYLYVSMKTDVDKNMGTLMEGDSGVMPAAMLKSSAVRLVARKNVKVSIDGTQSYIFMDEHSCVVKLEGAAFLKMTKDKITIDGKNIELGAEAAQHLLRGENFQKMCFDPHVHDSSMGPTTPPLPQFQIATNANDVLSSSPSNVTVK